jgi:mono/diheme cytochrome c family protein
MSRARFGQLILATLVAATIAGCGDDKPAPVAGEAPTDAAISPEFDINRIANGAKLYQENCAQCHGPEAQGHPDWERGRKEGFAAAPPLNGTGTEVKLSQAQMIHIIRNGVTRDNIPLMPAWQGRVADKDLEDIIAWFQALWPGEVYNKWRRAKLESAPAAKG